jgi:SNF2 family DNA or RNA helicase
MNKINLFTLSGKENETLKLNLNSSQSLSLPSEVESRLFDHQRFGVSWLYSCYCRKSGALLGDDMGLGKTFQVTALLCGLIKHFEIFKVLILCPISVLESWRREIETHLVSYTKVY